MVSYNCLRFFNSSLTQMGKMRIPGTHKAPGNTYCSVTSGNRICINFWRHSLGSPSLARKFRSHSEKIECQSPSIKCVAKGCPSRTRFSTPLCLWGTSTFLEDKQLISTCWQSSRGIVCSRVKSKARWELERRANCPKAWLENACSFPHWVFTPSALIWHKYTERRQSMGLTTC